jgi:hypothetical protein
MPLLSYFVVVGSALMALVYLAGTVLPHDDVPIYISSQIEGLPAARQQARTDDPISPLKPTTSFAAAYPTVPSTVGQAQPQITPPPATSAPKPQKPAPRRREWQDSFAQADDGWHGGRRWNDQRRRNDGWRDQRWRDQGWRDRGWGDRGRRDRGGREPFWGWR